MSDDQKIKLDEERLGRYYLILRDLAAIFIFIAILTLLFRALPF